MAYCAGKRVEASMYKCVKPILSADICDAKLLVLGLYRACYRYLPYIVKYHDITQNVEQCRWKLRELFYKNASVEDVRVIDILVIKGYMDLKEIKHQWAQKQHVAAYWNPSREPKPCDFIGKFLHSKY